MSYKIYKNDPREIVAKYDCVCAETGKAIKKGDFCIYYPLSKKIFHEESNTAGNFREWEFDIKVMGCNY